MSEREQKNPNKKTEQQKKKRSATTRKHKQRKKLDTYWYFDTLEWMHHTQERRLLKWTSIPNVNPKGEKDKPAYAHIICIQITVEDD